MNKFRNLLIIFVFCGLFFLAACGNDGESPASEDNDSLKVPFSSVVSVVETPQPAATPAPIATVPPTATPVYTPAPTPSPTPVPTVVPQVTITKSPISETVAPGGTAVFTAYADYSTSVNWIVASPDRKTIYTLADSPNHFPGLTVSGVNSNVITLTNIPITMNGWEIQAYFTGAGGPKYSADAYITVVGTPSPTPGSISETLILQNAHACVQASKYCGQFYGYTVSDMSNYKYNAPTAGNSQPSATFNINFTNSRYIIVAEFISMTDGYYPSSAAVFDTSWSMVQAYSFINNVKLNSFADNVLAKYQ